MIYNNVNCGIISSKRCPVSRKFRRAFFRRGRGFASECSLPLGGSGWVLGVQGAGGGYTLNLKCMMSPSCTT